MNNLVNQPSELYSYGAISVSYLFELISAEESHSWNFIQWINLLKIKMRRLSTTQMSAM
jgi:hypothetical protein